MVEMKHNRANATRKQVQNMGWRLSKTERPNNEKTTQENGGKICLNKKDKEEEKLEMWEVDKVDEEQEKEEQRDKHNMKKTRTTHNKLNAMK